jgi:starvation-inducible DNA-binding protein
MWLQLQGQKEKEIMSKLSDALKVLMADVVTEYFVAHGYHWNVEGSDFSQYHGLFEDIYGDVYGSIDPIAENLRKLDVYAPFSLKSFLDLRTVDSKEVKPEPKAMAKELLRINDEVLKSLEVAFKSATTENEQGVANFLADRIDMHQKWRWQLKASTK